MFISGKTEDGSDVHVETKYEFRDERELRRHTDVYNEDRIESIRNRIKKITVNEVQSKRMISRNVPRKSSLVW